MLTPPFIIYYMGSCNDCLTCDIAFNAVMPLSRASTRGSYSRIEGVTAELLLGPLEVLLQRIHLRSQCGGGQQRSLHTHIDLIMLDSCECY